MLLKLASKKNFYRQAKIVSSLVAFPGDFNSIEISRNNRGAYDPTIRELSNRPEDIFDLATDKIQKALEWLFFDFDRDAYLSREDFTVSGDIIR